jgi:hypothetical protein
MGFTLALYVNAFRDMIGGYDIYIYAEVYENLKYNGNIFNWEIGFHLVSVLLNFISSNRYFYFAILAFYFMFGFLFIAKRHNTKFNTYLIFFLIYCKLYFYSFVYLRQFLALMLIWFGLLYYINNNTIKGRVLTFLSILFHLSSLTSLLMFIRNKIFKRWTVFFLFILGSLLGFVTSASTIFSFFGTILDNNKAIQYGEQTTNVINYFYTIEAVILFLWLNVRYKFYFTQDIRQQLIFNSSALYMFILLIAVGNASAIRLSWFFLIGPILFITNEIEKNKNRKDTLFILFLVLIYFSLVYFRIMIYWDNGDFMPYKSIFNDILRHGQWEFMEYRSK